MTGVNFKLKDKMKCCAFDLFGIYTLFCLSWSRSLIRRWTTIDWKLGQGVFTWALWIRCQVNNPDVPCWITRLVACFIRGLVHWFGNLIFCWDDTMVWVRQFAKCPVWRQKLCHWLLESYQVVDRSCVLACVWVCVCVCLHMCACVRCYLDGRSKALLIIIDGFVLHNMHCAFCKVRCLSSCCMETKSCFFHGFGWWHCLFCGNSM